MSQSCYLILAFILNLCHQSTADPPLGFLPNIIIFYADDFGYGDIEGTEIHFKMPFYKKTNIPSTNKRIWSSVINNTTTRSTHPRRHKINLILFIITRLQSLSCSFIDWTLSNTIWYMGTIWISISILPSIHWWITLK